MQHQIQPHTLTALPKTDFWRKPPALDTGNAPTRLVRVPSRRFTRARVTVRAPWERLYDQGGLFIVFPSGAKGAEGAGKDAASAEGAESGAGAEAGATVDVAGRFWLKAGIEFFHGRPNISIVAAREWADWSLAPLPSPLPAANAPPPDASAALPELTLEVEREARDAAAGTGSSLFVYVVRDGVRDAVPLREVTWAFEHEGELLLGTYAARPTAQGEGDAEGLVVRFDGVWWE